MIEEARPDLRFSQKEKKKELLKNVRQISFIAFDFSAEFFSAEVFNLSLSFFACTFFKLIKQCVFAKKKDNLQENCFKNHINHFFKKITNA